MTKKIEKEYRNRAIINALLFLVSFVLIITTIIHYYSVKDKWEGYLTIIQKQEAVIDAINVIYDVKTNDYHDSETNRIISNYDKYITVLKRKKSLKLNNETLKLTGVKDQKINEHIAAISDTWVVIKSALNDKKKGNVVSDKEFYDNISDIKQFHNSLALRVIQLKNSTDNINLTLVIISFLLFIATIVWIAFFYKRVLFQPLSKLNEKLTSLVSGDHLEKDRQHDAGYLKPEFKNLIKIDDFNSKASVALAEYGRGNFDFEFSRRSENDILGESIEQMRFRVKAIIDEDRKKSAINNRINQGMAKFSDILQRNSHDVKLLIDTFVTEITQYFEANQGALYLLNNNADKLDDQTLELQFTYAWNRKKFKSNTFLVGENLAGQAVLENDTIYITNVPDNYIEITSGIGNANPKSILIVPLKLNEQPKGVIEIASFKEFEKYEIELIEKLCENLASTITNTLANEKTRLLLEDARKMTKAMKEQEDLMRRNQEEMQVEQEAAKREINRLEAQLDEIKHQKDRLEKDLQQYKNG